MSELQLHNAYLTIGDTVYEKLETIQYNSESYTEVFSDGKTVVMVDYFLCEGEELIPYYTITIKQNQYMYSHDKVYRFYYNKDLTEETMNHTMNDNNEDYVVLSDRNRDYVADNTPTEEAFERSFSSLFGYESLSKLRKEYPINDEKGNSYVLDYYFENDTNRIGVEENGVTYHHPQIIKEKKYIHQLDKQNACTKQNIKLYRFSSQDLQFTDKMYSEMEEYFKPTVETAHQQVLKGERKFELYEHQKENLETIAKKREAGVKACLVVLPTATGKSKIIEEDLSRISKRLNVLVLCPTRSLVDDWIDRLSHMHQHDIHVCTYSFAIKGIQNFPPDYYDYIVVDEAHHAVAPMLRRALQYFNPWFMVGLTATDQRLDGQKLEEVFGQYETKLTLEEAVNQGIVSKIRSFRIESNLDLSHVRFNGKDYVNADLERSIRVESRNDLIARVIRDYFSEGVMVKKQGVIFCVNVNHAREMKKVLTNYGISCETLVSGDGNAQQIVKDFKDKKYRFLCSCNMISEGWDYPQLEILVMARPTMSKVLYLQQIGRGLRKAKNKECVYIIDVVDEYGLMVRPWSLHAVFNNPYYVPWANPTRRPQIGDAIVFGDTVEYVRDIHEIDILTFENKYKDYVTVSELAVDCFVNDHTIVAWVKKGDLVPDVQLPFGSRTVYLFSKETVVDLKERKHIGKHDETTIKQDFYDFVKEKDYTFSFKMVFMLSLIKNADINGLADIRDVLKDYTFFYQERLGLGLPVDRAACTYNQETLQDEKYMKSSMLTNPFEKFERKRFIVYSKDLGKFAFSSYLWNALTKEDINGLQVTYYNHLVEYYRQLGGLQDISYLTEVKYEL